MISAFLPCFLIIKEAIKWLNMYFLQLLKRLMTAIM